MPDTTSVTTSDLFQLLLEEFQKEQLELGKLSQSNVKEGLRAGNVFANGGWNGSGGGGGYACFKNERDLKTFREPDGTIKPESYQNITKFHLLDLYINTPVIWPTLESQLTPKKFIEERIQTRISPFFPTLGQALLYRINEIDQKSWSYFPVEYPIYDQWAEGTNINPPPLCTYVTWVLRPQYVKEKKPFFFLAVNAPLEKRLKVLLTTQEFEQQLATLKLHEAIYTILSHLGERDSNNTRGLIDIILKPEAPKNSNATFIKLWLRGLNPLLLQLSKDLTKVLEQKIKLVHQSSLFIQGIDSQLEWLEKMNLAYKMFEEFLNQNSFGRGPIYINVDDAEVTNSKLYQLAITFSMVGIASVENEEKEAIHPRAAVLFLNTILPLQAPHVSSEELAVSQSSAIEWQNICTQLKLPSTKSFINQAMEPSMRSVGVWVLNRALEYCSQSVPMDSAKATSR